MKRLFPALLLLCCALSAFGQNYTRMISGVNNQTGTSYTFVALDATRLTTFQNASSVAVTLPSGLTAGFGAGSIFAAQNLGPSLVTITCSSCLIFSNNSVGSATYQLGVGQGVELWGAGTNFDAHLTGPSLTGLNAFVMNPGTFGTPCNLFVSVQYGATDPCAYFLATQGAYPTDSLTAIMTCGAGATTHQCNAVDAMVISNAVSFPLGSKANAVALYGYARANVNNSAAWAGNLACSDGIGTSGTLVICLEPDVGLQGAPNRFEPIFLTGGPLGLDATNTSVIGTMPAAPTPGTILGSNSAACLICVSFPSNVAPTPLQIPVGIFSGRGYTPIGLLLDASTYSGSGASQALEMCGNDGAAAHCETMSVASSGNFSFTGLAPFTKYNGVTLAANGIPTTVATVDLTAQGANIGPATLYAVPASGGGPYHLSCIGVVTRAGSVSSTLPSCSVTYTDLDSSVSETFQMCATNSTNTIGSLCLQSPIVVSAKGGTNITYTTAGYATAGGTSMQYALHLRAESF